MRKTVRIDVKEEGSERERTGFAAAAPATVALWGIFVVLLASALYLARSIVLPVVLAGVLSLVFGPVVRSLRRIGIPPAFGAALLLGVLLGSLAYGAVALSGPAAEWTRRAPEAARQIEHKLSFLRDPVSRVNAATEEMAKATQLRGTEEPRSVVVERRSLSDVIFHQTQAFLVGFGMTAVLLYFLLASPDDFLDKVVSLVPRVRDQRRVIAAAREIGSEVSGYLLTISAINAVFGAAVGVAMFLLGVPNAALWGVLAAVTNYVPYLGALALTGVLGGVGVLSFDEPWRMLLPAGVFLLLNTVEANLVTPMVLGRRLTLSPVIVFVWIAFWYWLWGIAGGLIAVPLLAAGKIALQRFPPLAPLARLLD